MKEEFYDLVERSIDVAFENDKFLFRCYDYMKSTKTTRKDCREFINSGTAQSINGLISDLEYYIKGGDKVIREAYGRLGKPKARKIKNYLSGILSDASKYEQDRKPGRKKRSK